MTKEKVWEYVKAIGIALVLALIIRAYVVQAFKIPSESMVPTLVTGDHILVNKFIYGTKLPFSDQRILPITKPKYGDVIVFKYPEDPSRDFIKRVIAVEGDVVESRNKAIYVNGKRLQEPYVQYLDGQVQVGAPQIGKKDDFGPYLVPKGKIFVMGDNRDRSYDSRFWGYVDMKDLRGKAFIIYWSWNAKKTFPRFGRLGHLIH